MSLDIKLSTALYENNITHNLTDMAEAAGVYGVIWRPEENDIETAGDLIEPLGKGLALLKAEPEKFKRHNPPNGWGTYEDFVVFVGKYLQACCENPDAEVTAWR